MHLPLIKLDELQAFIHYWNDIPQEDRHDPTEDREFDERYSAWLRDNSVWVPLKVFVKSNPDRFDRSRISREPDHVRSSTLITRSSRPNRARRGMCLRKWLHGF